MTAGETPSAALVATREAANVFFPDPLCGECGRPVDTNGTSYWCEKCGATWDSDGGNGTVPINRGERA